MGQEANTWSWFKPCVGGSDPLLSRQLVWNYIITEIYIYKEILCFINQENNKNSFSVSNVATWLALSKNPRNRPLEKKFQGTDALPIRVQAVVIYGIRVGR